MKGSVSITEQECHGVGLLRRFHLDPTHVRLLFAASHGLLLAMGTRSTLRTVDTFASGSYTEQISPGYRVSRKGQPVTTDLFCLLNNHTRR